MFCNDIQFVNFVEDDLSIECAYIQAKDDTSVYLVLCLPKFSDRIFFSISDGLPDNIARYVAHVAEVDSKKNIDITHVIQFSDEYMEENGVVGVLLSSHKLSKVFQAIDHEFVKHNMILKPIFLIFISHVEYRVWKESGNNSLMDYFSKTKKDVILFNQL